MVQNDEFRRIPVGKILFALSASILSLLQKLI